MSAFQPGDRVVSELLGAGTVVGEIECLGPGFLRVHFDRPPPLEYSFGNPCLVLAETLERLREEGEASRLPSLEELYGSDPDLTGDMTTEEYLAWVRGERFREVL